MKLLLGYFDSEGAPIGKKLDSARRKKYYVALATIRKKIAEKEGQNPFRKKEFDRHRIRNYSKTYCDKTRAFIYIEKYESGQKTEEIHTAMAYFMTPTTREEMAIKKICEHILERSRTYFKPELRLSKAYLPDSNEKNFERA